MINRVVLGLPKRYEEAKAAILRLEDRISLINSAIASPWNDEAELRLYIAEVLDGKHDTEIL